MPNRDVYDVLFAVIAPREVDFFSRVADVLQHRRNLRCGFVTFYGPGEVPLRRRGYAVFNPHKELRRHCSLPGPRTLAALEAKYGVQDVRDLILHEKLTFDRRDESRLLAKLGEYDRFFDRFFRQHRVKNVVQELGGFIAPLVCYHNCLAHGIRHVFIEPSLYKSRLRFNVDSTRGELGPAITPEGEILASVRKYIADYQSSKIVVIPQKDRHHFVSSGLAKLINWRSGRRLAEKLYYKYVRRDREEYDAIANHVKTQILMLLRRLPVARFYTSADYHCPYAYFPLHVPLDFQLTVRERRYLDQMALARRIAQALPEGWKLYIKEHPAAIGGYAYSGLKRLVQDPRVRLIEPMTNSYDLIHHARCIITINSKVGAEALMQGKRVLVLGHPLYAQAQGAVSVEHLDGLARHLRESEGKPGEVDYAFFCRAFVSSCEGELYDNSEQNVHQVALALSKRFRRDEHAAARGREPSWSHTR